MSLAELFTVKIRSNSDHPYDVGCRRGYARIGAKSFMTKVTLEPELEEEVALYTPSQRLELARKMERWARQLRVSAFILRRDSCPKRACASIKGLPRRRLLLN